MKLEQVFKLAIEQGKKADPRGAKGVQKFLAQQKKQYEALEGQEKEWADESMLWNPYADSQLFYGAEREVQSLLIGIDTETEDLVLADRLRERGQKIDAVMTHHPEGRALWDIDRVMPVQVDLLQAMGVPENRSEALLGPRREKIYRHLHARNVLRAVRAAELLDIPFCAVHNAADHLAAKHVRELVAKKEFDSLGEIVKALQEVPEYAHFAKQGNPPMIAQGSKSSRPGKVIIFGFNGGTNGPSEFIEEMSNAGVGTFLSMHISDDDRKLARKHHVNVIQCSHMASDSLGMNLIADALQKKDKKLKIVEASGFVRVKR